MRRFLIPRVLFIFAAVSLATTPLVTAPFPVSASQRGILRPLYKPSANILFGCPQTYQSRTNVGPFERIVTSCSDETSGLLRSHDIVKTINVIPDVAVYGETIWYVASCTQSAGLGTFSILTPPKHGTVNFRDIFASAPAPCPTNGPLLPAVQADYTWTSKNQSDKTDYFQLNYLLNGQVAAVVDITVRLTKLAVMFEGTSVTTKQNVAIGQAIDVKPNVTFEKPSVVRWGLTGDPIGGFDPSSPCAAPAADTCLGSVVPIASLNKPDVNFYWYQPGTYRVNETVTLDSGKTTTADATFEAVGPTAEIKVTADPKLIKINKSKPDGGEIDCGIYLVSPCMHFQPTLVSPFSQNDLQFVQLINKSDDDITTVSGGKEDHYVCSATNRSKTATSGLDESYPDSYVSHSTSVFTAYDSPSFGPLNPRNLLGTAVSHKVAYSAEMFLMWRLPGKPSIYVPLGSIQWNLKSGATFKQNQWILSASSLTYSKLLPPEFPRWSSVILDNLTICK